MEDEAGGPKETAVNTPRVEKTHAHVLTEWKITGETLGFRETLVDRLSGVLCVPVHMQTHVYAGTCTCVYTHGGQRMTSVSFLRCCQHALETGISLV